MQGKANVPLSPHLLHGGGVYLIHGLVQSSCGLIVVITNTLLHHQEIRRQGHTHETRMIT